MTRIPSSAPADDQRRLDGHQPLEVARHQRGLLDAGGDVGVEPALPPCGAAMDWSKSPQ
jgi:hypothetical protein